MNKCIKLMVIIVIIIVLSACSLNFTKNLDSDILKEPFSCSEFKNVVSIHGNNETGYFYTNEGSLYRYHVYKKFSNRENCKLVNRFKDNVVGMLGNIINTSDGRYYDTNFLKFEENIVLFSNKALTSVFDEYGLNNFIYDGYMLDYYFFKKNNLYYVNKNKFYKVNCDFYNNPPLCKINFDDIIFQIDSNEKIIDIQLDNVKTDKAFYRTGIINRKECNNTASECKYGIYKDEYLSKNYRQVKKSSWITNVYNNDYKNLYFRINL